MKAKPAQRKYTDAQRAEILEHYRVHGARPTLRKYKPLSQTTLYRWAHRAGVETEAAGKERTDRASAALAAQRKELRAKLLTRATEMLDRMGEEYVAYIGKEAIEVTMERPPAGVSKDLAITFGILYDKLALEEGKPTGRSALDVTVTDEDRQRVEEDIARAIAEAEQIARDSA